LIYADCEYILSPACSLFGLWNKVQESEWMPTILMILGWRLYFYANEGNEPLHIHCAKGECECKFWIDVDNYEIDEAFSYNLSPRNRREIREIIFKHFDYIVNEWIKFKELKK
jgi:hypothetical protein